MLLLRWAERQDRGRWYSVMGDVASAWALWFMLRDRKDLADFTVRSVGSSHAVDPETLRGLGEWRAFDGPMSSGQP